MPEKKKIVTSPLQLLHELALGVLAHLESACSKALAEAESVADKLDDECDKAQLSLLMKRLELHDAVTDGKVKLHARLRKRVHELEERLHSLKDRRAQALQYVVSLKHDTEESMTLAEGLRQVREAADLALSQRQTSRVSTRNTAAGKLATNRSRQQL